ncbi:MAG: hypothetical protein HY368_02500 [Candidatus Aenigmarchaeota archaeon]|nr:hypothetical protein [Candidatus Aenigmarchaeota archaeon]
MLFFGKKKQEQARPTPVEDVERMSKMGMSDRDIIRYLKNEGYSYPEIEKAMMSAVKKGVGEPVPQAAQASAAPAQRAEQMPELPELPDISQATPATVEEQLGLGEPELEINPEVIVEELVEGVVQEKWQKFEEKTGKLEEELNRLRADMQQWSHRLESAKHESGGKESDAKVHELGEQMEELQARVGGLEKAFKQFLPALTKNIESLSRMIHEMKEKRGVVEAES